MSDKTAYPLHWPAHWDRTKKPTKSQFKTSLNGAMTNVEDSLRRFAADTDKKIERLVISSNFSLSDRRPTDAGVAVYFTWDGIETCICVDRYIKIEENLQAIHHCIEAERTKMRHGGLNLVRASFRGYAALPAPKSNDRAWFTVLNVPPDSARAAVSSAYKKLRSRHHPDNGGDPDKFAEVQQAWHEYGELRG